MLDGGGAPGRAWDYAAVRRHCPFVGLVCPVPAGANDGDGDRCVVVVVIVSSS